jgi:hypothetical protein
MVIRVILLAILSAASMAPLASADSPNSTANSLTAEVSVFVMTSNARASFVLCGLHYQLYALKGYVVSEDSNPKQCIKDAKAEVTQQYKDARTALEGNDTAAKSAKSFFAFWRTAMEGIWEHPRELAIDYKRRQSSAQEKIVELQSILEVDLL